MDDMKDHCSCRSQPASQGGGLVRAILADPNGGFAVRAITRDPSKDKAKALAAAGAEVVSAESRRRREPEEGVRGRVRRVRRHQLLGALLRREGEGAGQEHRRRRQGRRRQARDLVDARRHAQVHEAPTTSACRCCRRSTACRTSTRRPKPTRTSPGVPTTFLVTSFYWDNLYMFGLAPKKGDDGQLRAGRSRWATRSWRASPAEDIGKVALRHLQGAARSTSARPSASSASS